MVKSMPRTDGWWMMGSARSSGSLVPLRARIEVRSRAYHSEFCKAHSAAACPCTAVPTREVLMKVNMWPIPRFSVPISHPFAFSNSSWHVGLPWQPILSSMRLVLTPFNDPSGSFLGTRNKEIPRVPAGLAAAGGASGRRASTQCTMLSVKSWSPHEMKILVPVMLYESGSLSLTLGLFTALVMTWPRSLPHPGSVKHMVPMVSPLTRSGRYLALSSSEPCMRSVLMAPLLRPGNMPKVQLAAAIISLWMSARDMGRFCPPNSSGKLSPCHWASVNCLYASLKPGGVVVVYSSTQEHPMRSLSTLERANCPAS
mmetsp:Transcript_51535/g.102199  ORF Transcript_51535/g.102199 Transcript_51535/m.102199 type:complete len:313 (-) Transcript_51535:244-1182(-)